MNLGMGAVLVMIVAACIGCGSPGTDGAAQQSASAVDAAPADQSDASGAECESGRVSLNGSDGRIVFGTLCVPARSGDQRTLSVAVGMSGAKPGSLVRRYQPRIRAMGEDFRGGGPCSLDRDAIVCRAQYRGRASLSGGFWVSAADRCEINVVMTAPEPPRCRSSRCRTDLRSHVLFDGRPRGC